MSDKRQPVLSLLGIFAFFVWIASASPYGNSRASWLAFTAFVSVIALSILFNRNPEAL